MKRRVYSLFDRAIECYLSPALIDCDRDAMESIRKTIQAGPSALTQSPGDFALFQIAEFDDSTGEFVSFNPPRLVCNVNSIAVPRVYSDSEEGDAARAIDDLRDDFARARRSEQVEIHSHFLERQAQADEKTQLDHQLKLAKNVVDKVEERIL